jgi:hypothetical protein
MTPQPKKKNNNSIPVQFPKCRNCKDKDTYLKFDHQWGYIGNGNWYYCPKCLGMFLIRYD